MNPLAGGFVKPVQADSDQLVETILKAAASALSGALAEGLVRAAKTEATTEGEDKGTTQQGQGTSVPTRDVDQIAAQIAQHKTQEATKEQTFWDWAEEFARTALQKAVLDVVVDQIISWIQGNGKPQFVTDWQGFAKDAADRAGGEFIESLDLGFLCEPFNLQIQFAVGGTPKKFSEEAKCTLTDAIENIESFGEDFRSGGWVAFGESWQVQNNFFGSLINVQKRLGFQKEAAASAAVGEALAAGGFLSPKKCQKDKNGKDIPSTCKTVTPGKALGDLTSKALGSDIDFLLNADQLGEYVGAIVDALLNRVIEEGLAAATEE